jgi:hypothetical protein
MSRRTLAAATAVLIFVALLFGYVLDVTNNEEGDADVVGWLIVSAVASLIAAALLMRFVPASEADPGGDNKPARRALILGALSVITLAIFWTGLPFALGVPALALAATGRARAPHRRLGSWQARSATPGAGAGRDYCRRSKRDWLRESGSFGASTNISALISVSGSTALRKPTTLRSTSPSIVATNSVLRDS